MKLLFPVNLKTRFLTTIILTIFVCSNISYAAIRTASSSGNWNSSSTWGGASAPTNTDDVIINAGISVTIINGSNVCKTLKLNNNSSGTGSIIFQNGNSYLTVSDYVTLSGNSPNQNGSLNMINGGTMECDGFITGNGSYSFSEGIGTIILNANNSLPFSNVYNLTLKNGTTTLTKNLSILGNLTIGLSGTNSGVIDVSANNYTITSFGNWTHNNPNNGFNERNGTVIFSGTNTQTFNCIGSFYNVTINKSSGTISFIGSNGYNELNILNNLIISSGTLDLTSFAKKLTINGNLTITGTLDLSNNAITIPGDRTSLGGIITINSSGILKIGGTNEFPKNYATKNISPLSLVEYNGTTQTITGITSYGNILISTTGTKTLSSNTSIAGNITITNGTFNTNSKTITFNGTSTQKISGTLTMYNVIVNNTSNTDAIELLSPITITNNITFTDGIINALTNSLLLTNNASVTGASHNSHIKGSIAKTINGTSNFVFPTGDGEYYRPIGIVNPSNDTWTANYNRTPYNGNFKTTNPNDNPKIHHVSSLEYWNLTPNTLGSSAKIMVSWGPISDVLNPATTVIAHWNSTANYWESLNNVTRDSINQTITSANTWNTFSPFTLGSTAADESLPIELLYIESKCGQEGLVNVEWATATEKNNEYFNVYRSNDGLTWKTIARIPGSGNTNEVKKYNFIDEKPTEHDTYYKIGQVDYNGTKEDFDIMSIYCLYNHKHITFTPIPAENYLNFEFYNEHHIIDILTVNIYSQFGQLVTSQLFTSESDDNAHKIDLPESMKSGTYFIQVKLGDNQFYSTSFVKK